MRKTAWLLVAVLLLTTLASCGRYVPSEVESAFTTMNVSGGVKIVAYNGSYTTLDIPERIGNKVVVEIGDNVFSSSYLLTEVTIPETVVKIGDRAFQGCYALKEINIPDSVVAVGDYAFFGCWAATSLHIGASLASMGRQAIQYCKSLEKITVSEENKKFAATSDGILFSDNYKTLLCYPAASKTKNYTVPTNCTKIEDYAFRNCSNLIMVSIGSQVTSIGDGAFYGCQALEHVFMDSAVEELGYRVFADCTSLEDFVIPEGVKKLGYLVESGECGQVFENCTSLEHVTIPKSLTNIYANTFKGCTSLSIVVYNGNETMYKNIAVGEGNAELSGCQVYYENK